LVEFLFLKKEKNKTFEVNSNWNDTIWLESSENVTESKMHDPIQNRVEPSVLWMGEAGVPPSPNSLIIWARSEEIVGGEREADLIEEIFPVLEIT